MRFLVSSLTFFCTLGTTLGLLQGGKRRRVPTQLAALDKGFNLLEIASGVVPQGAIVQTAREGWKFAWQRMMAELAPQNRDGSYQRPTYGFSGKIGSAEFAEEGNGRYHLYVGNPCPWCHRVVLARTLRGMEADIGMTRLEDNPVKASRGGWIFASNRPDPLGSYDLRELYDKLSPRYKGRCTAPLLVDLKARKIVSNESADIVRMLCQVEFGDSTRMDIIPSGLEREIEETNEWVYRLLNNGVYRCGFSTSQAAYDRASADVREGLRRVEETLQKQDYLCGDRFTEADLRLLPTLLRFDGAYAPLFRAGGVHLRVRDFPATHRWLRRCWAIPGVSSSIDLADACSSYYKQLFPLNPGGLIPSPVSAETLGLLSQVVES